MEKDLNSVTFNAPVSKVFAYITQARFWPIWHTDSKAVKGVIDRPYKLGDIIYESGLTNGQIFDLYWHVVEYEENKKVVLYDKRTNTTLRYTFKEENGVTTYSRESKMDAATLEKLGLGGSREVVEASVEASRASIERLQKHVMGLVEDERKDIPELN